MEKLISLKDAGKTIGIHPETLRRACARGDIEFLRAGAQIRFTEEALARWLESCRVTRLVGEDLR